ncbi:hypothetical protein PIB30_067976, partial [Stylosanthes scabra]|nr:hypothetical protein [Stylosanthes scabra]
MVDHCGKGYTGDCWTSLEDLDPMLLEAHLNKKSANVRLVDRMGPTYNDLLDGPLTHPDHVHFHP